MVVSPHLDDAVLSLGATAAHARDAGAQLEILTVFGYDPNSSVAAGPWDAKSGFRTEGEAASRRRVEDQAACAALGAQPRWLDFGAEPYLRNGSDDEIWSAVAAVVGGADTVLLPGYPLQHPDHADLTRLLLRRPLGCNQLGLYAEQPYAFYEKCTPRGAVMPEPLQAILAKPPVWDGVPCEPGYRRAKLHAVRAYQSQLRSLGLKQTGRGHLRLRYMIWLEGRKGGESIAWLS